jgi:hypothetical protein
MSYRSQRVSATGSLLKARATHVPVQGMDQRRQGATDNDCQNHFATNDSKEVGTNDSKHFTQDAKEAGGIKRMSSQLHTTFPQLCLHSSIFFP